MRARILRVPRQARLAAVAVVVAGAGWWALSGRRPSEDADWVRVARDDLVLGVDVTGFLKAVDSTVVSPPAVRETWNYKISMLAPEGAQVKKGEPVVGFDTSDLDRKLEQKIAEAASAAKQMEKKQVDVTLRRREDDLRLAEAEARERKAALKVDRPAELAAAAELRQARLDLGLARDEIAYLKGRLESARAADEAELTSLRNQRDRAEERVKEIRESIGRMTVGAPRDGTVIYVTDWRETKKKVGDSMWRAERLMGLWMMGSGGPPYTAEVRMFADGGVTLKTGAMDLGTGTKTAACMVAAEELGVPLENIRIINADTAITPYASSSGGSMTLASLVPAIRSGAWIVKRQILGWAAESLGVPADDLEIKKDSVVSRSDPGKKRTLEQLFRAKGVMDVIAIGNREPNPANKVVMPFSSQFAEVEVNTRTGEVRVIRLIGTDDSGRVVNLKTYEDRGTRRRNHGDILRTR